MRVLLESFQQIQEAISKTSALFEELDQALSFPSPHR